MLCLSVFRPYFLYIVQLFLYSLTFHEHITSEKNDFGILFSDTDLGFVSILGTESIFHDDLPDDNIIAPNIFLFKVTVRRMCKNSVQNLSKSNK